MNTDPGLLAQVFEFHNISRATVHEIDLVSALSTKVNDGLRSSSFDKVVTAD